VNQDKALGGAAQRRVPATGSVDGFWRRALMAVLVCGAAGLGLPQALASTSAKTRVDTPAKASRPAARSAAKPAVRVAKPAARSTKPVARKAASARKSTSAPRTAAARKAVANPPAGSLPAKKAASPAPRPVTQRVAAAATGSAVAVGTSAAGTRQSMGRIIGLHESRDPASLHSAVALAVDAETGEILFEKNANAVLPIASISKLMTAMVVLDADQPLDERLTITTADIDTEKFTRSRLSPGTVLTRDAMLQLALMASENRAANALGRHYPGGLDAFVARMNEKARELGMETTWFVEPTGLSSRNVSSALDLARLVHAASEYPLIRSYSTADSLTVSSRARPVSFHNTNRLLARDDWEIGVQKTGYISEAGNCLVMQARVEGRPVVLVFLDATGKLSRFGDARRLRTWLEGQPPRPDDSGPRAAIDFSTDS